MKSLRGAVSTVKPNPTCEDRAVESPPRRLLTPLAAGAMKTPQLLRLSAVKTLLYYGDKVEGKGFGVRVARTTANPVTGMTK